MLSVDSVDVFYGHAQALHNISLELKQGEFAFMVGRNGAGKTTLLKTICSLLSCKNGSITFENKDIQKLRTELLAQQGIRYIAQDKKVFSGLTVKENLQLASFAAKVSLTETIDMALEIYPEFKDLLNQKAGMLSGGQKEILLIVRALIGKPKLLLIDEPTEGLASIVIKDVFRLLKMMKGEVSAIIVEQNLKLVSQLADRVYTLREGHMVKEISNTKECAIMEELEAYL